MDSILSHIFIEYELYIYLLNQISNPKKQRLHHEIRLRVIRETNPDFRLFHNVPKNH